MKTCCVHGRKLNSPHQQQVDDMSHLTWSPIPPCIATLAGVMLASVLQQVKVYCHRKLFYDSKKKNDQHS
jgi:hypothetical protein